MLTKIHDEMYVDLEKLDCFYMSDGGEYYLAFQDRGPIQITKEQFKFICDIIDKKNNKKYCDLNGCTPECEHATMAAKYKSQWIGVVQDEIEGRK